MSLYAIGDLHFSTSVEKPMSIFGDKWDKHEEKIINSWKENVNEDDVVLVLGDTSWGINLQEAKSDLDIINKLPGEKIFIKGNHDYWWTTVTGLNKLYDNMNFLQTNFYEYKDYAICGGRGADSRVAERSPLKYRHHRCCVGLCADDDVRCGVGVANYSSVIS